MTPAPAGAAIAGPGPRSASDAALRLLLLAAYMALIGYAGVHHAMWRDEAQAWLIARDADGIAGLFDNLRYEGHPALWHLLLFGLNRISDDPNLMLALNFVLMSVATALVLWCLPLRTSERILFPFGTYMLFEYSVKARSYGLATLLVVLLCLAWPRRADRPLRLALVLALLANTHALLFLVTLAATAALALERLLGRPGAVALRWPAAAAALVLGAGWLLALATFIPPADTGIAATWNLGLSPERLVSTLGSLGAILGAAGDNRLVPVAAVVLAGTLLAIRREAGPATFLGLATGGLLAFIYTKLGGNAWTSGVLFLVVPGRGLDGAERRRGPHDPLRSRAPLGLPHRRARVPGLVRDRGLPGRTGAPLLERQGRRRLPRRKRLERRPHRGAGRPEDGGDHRLHRRRTLLFPQRRPLGIVHDLGPAPARPGGRRGCARAARRCRRQAVLRIDAMTPLDPAMLARHGFREAARFTGATRADEDFIVYRREAAPP